jgi:hypothetical protein
MGVETMNLEMLRARGNVVRFPVEARVKPALWMLYEIAPYTPQVERMAEVCGLAMPAHGLCDRVDAETAVYIAEHILPLASAERKRALEEMLDRVVTDAMDVCRRAEAATARFREAYEKVQEARRVGGYWLGPLEAREATLLQEAAALLVLAEQRRREVRGVDRAVGIALRGEAWAPEAHLPAHALGDWLVDAHVAVQTARQG